MAENVETGMIPDLRVPTRAAPRPPNNHVTQRNIVWSNGSDSFLDEFNPIPMQKKKLPPPRPPPPKFRPTCWQNHKDQKPKKPVRPTELSTLVSKIGRKSSKSQQQSSASFSSYTLTNGHASSATEERRSMCLIDLSPPSSPTFTTRSSSDGVSVDSFGSDGNSNPSAFTSGSTSQTESAFEDDFDFFGSLSSQKIAQNDPWKIADNQDPFSPRPTSNYVKEIGDASFFAFNNEPPSKPQVPFAEAKPQSMPTIIRPKIGKMSAPAAKKKLIPATAPSLTEDINSAWGNDPERDPSPPMPMIPPPAPPSEYFVAGSKDKFSENCEFPYGVALYDFPASQPGDLPLQVGNVVTLERAINSEWMEGRIGNLRGIFPVNFVDVKVPLLGNSRNIVNALYTFKGETFGDLSFEEGARISVLSRISSDWLYGEYQGKRGQFPANHVDRVPSSLPDHH